MSLYAANGSLNVTVVDGTSRTGLIAPDGSRYIVMSDGSAPIGVHHRCGAWNATYAPAGGTVPNKAPDGSFYVSDTRRDGALFVTVVSGSLGSRVANAPQITAVSITGTPEVGETLTATKTSSGSGTTTYKWFRNNSIIAGETSSTYDTTEDDLNKDISVEISMFNATGSDSMTSAALSVGEGGGGGDYVAQAVHFDGATWLDIASLTAIENGKLSFSFWFNPEDLPEYHVFFVGDRDNIYMNYIEVSGEPGDPQIIDGAFGVVNDPGSDSFQDTTPILPNQYYHLLGSIDLAAGKAAIYLTDAKIGIHTFTGSPSTLGMNAKSLSVGGDQFDDEFVGDMADMWIAPGISLLNGDGDIPEATRRLFISASAKPVDPAGFPEAAVLFSGDHTSFAANQGTGGAFTLTGSLTNASTSPSA